MISPWGLFSPPQVKILAVKYEMLHDNNKILKQLRGWSSTAPSIRPPRPQGGGICIPPPNISDISGLGLSLTICFYKPTVSLESWSNSKANIPCTNHHSLLTMEAALSEIMWIWDVPHTDASVFCDFIGYLKWGSFSTVAQLQEKTWAEEIVQWIHYLLHNWRNEAHISRTQEKWDLKPIIPVPERHGQEIPRQGAWAYWKVLGSDRNLTSVIN